MNTRHKKSCLSTGTKDNKRNLFQFIRGHPYTGGEGCIKSGHLLLFSIKFYCLNRTQGGGDGSEDPIFAGRTFWMAFNKFFLAQMQANMRFPCPRHKTTTFSTMIFLWTSKNWTRTWIPQIHWFYRLEVAQDLHSSHFAMRFFKCQFLPYGLSSSS